MGAELINEYTFNVEKKNTFIFVGGTYSGLELTILKNNKSIYGNSDNSIVSVENLDEEYIEDEFQGYEQVDAVAYQTIDEDANLKTIAKKDSERYKSSEKIGFGKLKSGMTDAQILKIMIDYIEGGYYYPAHASKFSESDRGIYSNSGETLWGIDRYAGQTEKEDVGVGFWAAVDKVSGYGETGRNGYARLTPTGKWDFSSYPIKSNAWSYGYVPSISTPGYDILYGSFIVLATENLNNWLYTYIGNHPVKDLILNDSRFKFLWYRSTWNGPGWFSWFARGVKNKDINGIKWAYDNVSKNVEELIVWDLNNRLKFNNLLINHDVKKMKELLAIK